MISNKKQKANNNGSLATVPPTTSLLVVPSVLQVPLLRRYNNNNNNNNNNRMDASSNKTLSTLVWVEWNKENLCVQCHETMATTCCHHRTHYDSPLDQKKRKRIPLQDITRNSPIHQNEPLNKKQKPLSANQKGKTMDQSLCDNESQAALPLVQQRVVLSCPENDTLRDMLAKENSQFKVRKYLVLPTLSRRYPQYLERHRFHLMKWFLELVEMEELSLPQRVQYLVAHNAILLVDQFLCRFAESINLCSSLQLIGATCLWILLKREGRENVTSGKMAEYCGGAYPAINFIKAERVILNTLEWQLSFVTALDFYDFFCNELLPLRKGNSDPLLPQSLNARADNYMNLIALNNSLLNFKPSIIAASIIATLREECSLESWSPQMEKATGIYYHQDLEHCKQELAGCMLDHGEEGQDVHLLIHISNML
jgi:hypothetical protein